MLTKIKDISRYVGRGVVHWDGKYSHRPYKCFIREVQVNTVYSQNEYGDKKTEKIRFAIYNPRLNKVEVVDNLELFDNFRACYQCIVDYSSFKSLCTLSRYDAAPALSGKKAMLEQMEKAISFISNTDSKETFEEYKSRIVSLFDESLRKVKDMDTRSHINYKYLRRCTLYGFIEEMRKRYPDLDIKRAHRMSEISFEEGQGE